MLAGWSPSHVLAALALSTLTASAGCGDDRGPTCGQEGSIGPGTGASSFAGLAVAPDGALVTVTNLVIFGLDAVGQPIISAKIVRHGPLGFVEELGGMHAQGPIVDAQGRVWVLAGGLRGFTAAGGALPPIPATTFVAVAQDGTLVTGGPAVGDTHASPEIVRWSIAGEALARRTLVDPGHTVGDVAIGGDGTIYAVEVPPARGGTGLRVHALTPGFDTKWTFDLEAESAGIDVAVTPEPGIVVGLGDEIVSLDAAGTLRWRFTGDIATAPIAVGPDGSVYTPGGAVSATGALRWRGGAPITVAADGTLYALGEDGLVTLDPTTGAIDKVLSHAVYSDRWELQPTFADAPGRGCIYTGALMSTDGIFVDPILLEAGKATRAGIATPWGIPGGNAGRTSAAPLAPAVPDAVADLYGFWTRDDGDDRLTLELAGTIADARAPAGPAYRVWRTEPYGAGEVVQVGGAALTDGRLVLTRAAGDGAGSTSTLAPQPWTELTLVDPLTGATATFRRAYGVARPSRPSPTIDNAYQTDTVTDEFQTLGGDQGARAFADPGDGAFWLVQSIAGVGDAIEVHRLDPRTESAEAARVAVPPGMNAPDLLAGHVDDEGRLVLLTETEQVVTIPRDPSQAATITSGDDHWWQLAPWADALAEAEVSVDARAIDAAGDITIAGTFDGVLDLGDGVRLERIGPEPGLDFFLARLGADGEARWARAFAMTTPGAPWPHAPYDPTLRLAVFDDGGVALAGRFSHRGPYRDNPQTVLAALDLGLGPLVDTVPLDAWGPGDGFLVRFGPDGDPLGQALLPGRELRGLAADPSGLLVATGIDRIAGATQGLVAVYDRCGRELTWDVPPCEVCFGPPRLRDLAGTDLALAPDGRLMVAAETLSTRVGAAAFVAPIVPAGDTVPSATCATPAAARPRLSVTLDGDGSGRVVSDPPGIDCPGACEASFDPWSHVTLSATAAADAWHAGWSGCLADGAACRWQARGDGAVSARFERPARHAVATSLPERVFAGSLRARHDGALVLSVTTDTTIDLAAGVTLRWSDAGAWVTLEADGALRWASVIDSNSRPRWESVTLGPADDILAIAHNGVSLMRWSPAGAPLAAWPIDLAYPGDRNRNAADLAAPPGGGALVLTYDLVDTVVWRYDADGVASPLTLPLVTPRRVFGLAGGDLLVVFEYAEAFDLLGQPVPWSGPGAATALARLAPTGTPRWVTPLSRPPIILDANAAGIGVAYQSPDVVQAFGLDGASRWTFDLDTPAQTLAIGSDGALTVGPSIARVTPNGARAWSTGLGGAFDVDAQGRTWVVEPGSPIALTVLEP